MPVPARTRVNLNTVESVNHSPTKHEVYKDPIQSNVCDEILGNIDGSNPKREECNARKRKVKKRHRTQSKKRVARLSLTHSSDVGQDYVSFQVDQPNRVAVRLELLMETAVVKLNDKEYMKNLYDKLTADEIKKTSRYLKMREKLERERVKELVVSGSMIPTDDLEYLYKHPVFRVNAMLKRLEDHNTQFYAPDKPKIPIIAIDPFEFEPNGKFFSHLHQTGTLWIPEEEIQAREEKLQGKIERAKQRLLEKRHIEAEEAKALRLLYKSDNEKEKTDDYQSMTSMDSGTPAIESDSSQEKENRGKMATKSKFFQHMREETRMTLKDRKRRDILEQREKDRLIRQEERMKERDKQFFDEKQQERERIIERHRQRMFRFDRPAPLKKQRENKQSTLGSIFTMQDTPPNLQEDSSFKKLRQRYNLRGDKKFETYRPPNNALIAKYIDTSQTARELFEYGKAIKSVYERGQRRGDDYMIQLNRLF